MQGAIFQNHVFLQVYTQEKYLRYLYSKRQPHLKLVKKLWILAVIGHVLYTKASGAGETEAALRNGGTCRQLPLGTGAYTTCMALPLSDSAARSFHDNGISV